MKRYLIEDAQCGIGAGGMACGPIFGPVIAEVKLRDETGESTYVLLAEVDGTANFCFAGESTFELHINQDPEDEAWNEILMDEEFCEYEELFDNPDPEWLRVYRYLIYLVRSDWDECKRFQEATIGKYMNEIEIPMSDVEKEYWGVSEDDEDDDE